MFDKKNVILVLILIAIFGGIIAFNHKRPRPVETLSAYISSDSVSIQADNSGKIKSLSVKQDEKVQKGQVIAEIETSKSVVKSVDPSSQTHKPTEQEYENVAIMYKDGVISQEEYDKHLANLKKAETQSEKPVSQVVYTSHITKIYAPIDGTIVLNNLKEGDSITKEAILAKVNSSHKEVKAYFPVSTEKEIQTGREVNITVIKYPEKTFTGKINIVSEAESKGIPVTITFDEDTSNLDFQNGDSVIVKIKQ